MYALLVASGNVLASPNWTQYLPHPAISAVSPSAFPMVKAHKLHRPQLFPSASMPKLTDLALSHLGSPGMLAADHPL
jgi:hypothetical protein